MSSADNPQLEECLRKYGKTIEDFKNTDGFVEAEFLRLSNELDNIIDKVKEFQISRK